MVFALAGDSTMTTFMQSTYVGQEPALSGASAQRHEIAGMTLDAAGKFQLEQQRGDRGG